MIKGRGLLANALRDIDEDKYLFYANGISNSVLSQIPKDNFEINEIEEIADKNEQRTFVYFSTSQVNSEKNYDRAYVKHKLFIEQLIAEQFPKYLIIRTANLVGHNPWNRHTLFNFLYNAIIVNERIIVDPGVIRNFLDADHFTVLVQTYLDNYENNKIIEIVNPGSYTMQQVVNEFEQFFSKKFNLQKVYGANDFAQFELNIQLTLELMEKCELSFDNHIQSLLEKYYKRNGNTNYESPTRISGNNYAN